MISWYPQKNTDYVQSKQSTSNSLVPNSKYRNYISQANGANNKVSLQPNLTYIIFLWSKIVKSVPVCLCEHTISILIHSGRLFQIICIFIILFVHYRVYFSCYSFFNYIFFLTYQKNNCIFINTNQFPIDVEDVNIFLPRNSWANICELYQLQWLIFSCSNILHNPAIKMSKAAHKPLVVTLKSVWSKVYNWQFMIGNDFLKICLR